MKRGWEIRFFPPCKTLLMKVQSIQLKNFKRFRNSPLLDFTDSETGLARDLIVLIGRNGSGKTSILQAIAATLGVATGRLRKLSDLEWPGFTYELLGIAPEVTLQVQFSSPELQAVHEFRHTLQGRRDVANSPHDDEPIVTLRWENERIRAGSEVELLQFKGREYAKQLLRSEGFKIFERVGTILWYTEQRTSTSLTSENPNSKLEITDAYDNLRDQLSTRWNFHQAIETGKISHLRPGQKDIYNELEKSYKTVFPGRSFQGCIPREDIDAFFSKPWFYLDDGKNYYEISEMSGGERAIFPILVDFANWNIHNSVILIDEIELHLHPPMQQALLRALPKLGTNNQFIITTHSDYIEKLVPEDNIVRLDRLEVKA